MSDKHHLSMSVDVVRAYHFGKRFLVEIEVVLPKDMCVEDAHDIALELQKKVEKLHKVERAFVHVDYMTREENEHKQNLFTMNTPPHTPPSEPLKPADRVYPDIDHNVEVNGDVYKRASPILRKKS